jgi:hypothetical protein
MLGHPARCAGAALEVVGLLSLRPQPIAGTDQKAAPARRGRLGKSPLAKRGK